MSSLIVQVCNVDKVLPHSNADRMSVIQLKGWKVCTGKDQFKENEKVVYFPPDSIIPTALAERLNVMKYLSPVKENGTVIGGRVRVARLRSEPSYGFVMACENDWPVGTDVAEHYGITKWEPPLVATDGDAERDNPAFHRYYNMENYRNFPDLFKEGEEVVFTEKIHGQNLRIGKILVMGENGEQNWEYMAGSHAVRRKEFQVLRKRKVNPETGEEEFYEVTVRSKFFAVLDKPGVKELLDELSCDGNVVVFAELFGEQIQDMTYGLHNSDTDFRVFDITVNGKYLDYCTKKAICDKHSVMMVPILYRGPFSKEKVEEFVSGPTTVCDPSVIEGFNQREGIVITPVTERSEGHPEKWFDRVMLKAINFAYLERKNATEFH